MSFEQAAAFTMAYGTAWHALRTLADLRAGEILLVLGAALGVCLASVQIGLSVCATVIASSSSHSRPF